MVLKLGSIILKNELPALVMGILNATPDSFFSESRGDFERGMKLISEGADILDIGGESTRPGFTQVSEQEEIERVVPLVQKIRKESDIIISIDTRKAEVARLALENGADIINDVTSLDGDKNMIKVLKEKNCPVVIMHGYGLDEGITYGKKIVPIVQDFFNSRVSYLLNEGIQKENIILDPGIGFGKSFEDNVWLIKKTDELCEGDFPLLMALSRKRCIGQLTDTTIEERLTGTVCADLISVIKGASIIRVHDVKEAVQSLKIMKNLF